MADAAICFTAGAAAQSRSKTRFASARPGGLKNGCPGPSLEFGDVPTVDGCIAGRATRECVAA